MLKLLHKSSLAAHITFISLNGEITGEDNDDTSGEIMDENTGQIINDVKK